MGRIKLVEKFPVGTEVILVGPTEKYLGEGAKVLGIRIRGYSGDCGSELPQFAVQTEGGKIIKVLGRDMVLAGEELDVSREVDRLTKKKLGKGQYSKREALTNIKRLS